MEPKKPIVKRPVPQVPQVPDSQGVRPETQYMREWRNRNRERYNAYQREYMRNYRARKNEETAALHGDVQHPEGSQEGQGKMPAD
jgi:hypothetical protein